MLQEHLSVLDKVFMEALALVPTFALPASDGALVQREGRDDGLYRAAVRQQGYATATTSSCGLCTR